MRWSLDTRYTSITPYREDDDEMIVTRLISDVHFHILDRNKINIQFLNKCLHS